MPKKSFTKDFVKLKTKFSTIFQILQIKISFFLNEYVKA